MFDELKGIFSGLESSIDPANVPGLEGVPKEVLDFLTNKANDIVPFLNQQASSDPEVLLNTINTLGDNISSFMAKAAEFESVDDVVNFISKFKDANFLKAISFEEVADGK